MNLNDPLNLNLVYGHRGPHPEAYHVEVLRRLTDETSGLSGAAYADAFKAELAAIGAEVRTPGTPLNILVTRP